MTRQAFRAALDAHMCDHMCDDWSSHAQTGVFLDQIAIELGFTDWIDAYHRLAAQVEQTPPTWVYYRDALAKLRADLLLYLDEELTWHEGDDDFCDFSERKYLERKLRKILDADEHRRRHEGTIID